MPIIKANDTPNKYQAICDAFLHDIVWDFEGPVEIVLADNRVTFLGNSREVMFKGDAITAYKVLPIKVPK